MTFQTGPAAGGWPDDVSRDVHDDQSDRVPNDDPNDVPDDLSDEVLDEGAAWSAADRPPGDLAATDDTPGETDWDSDTGRDSVDEVDVEVEVVEGDVVADGVVADGVVVVVEETVLAGSGTGSTVGSGQQAELELGVVPTGNAAVDAALARLEELPALPVEEHPDVFDDVHAAVHRALTELDEK